MTIRRTFLYASLSALALAATSVQAQNNVLRVGTDETEEGEAGQCGGDEGAASGHESSW